MVVFPERQYMNIRAALLKVNCKLLLFEGYEVNYCSIAQEKKGLLGILYINIRII